MSKISYIAQMENEAYYNAGASLDYQAQEAYELQQYMNSIEGQLAGYTDQELIDEYYRRMFAPYKQALKELDEAIQNLNPPF